MARTGIATLVCLLISYSSAISNESARTKLKTRTGRQWTGDLTVPTDCTFQVASARSPGAGYRSPVDRVSLCNFTWSTPQSDGVYAWQKGLASQASWLGGPTEDASGSADGGYAFFETSSLSVQQLPGIQAKAWLKSPVYEPTAPNGHCLRFSYNVQGVSASQLKLLRVQMLPLEGHSAAPQHRSAPLFVNSILLPTQQPAAQSQQFKSTSDVFAAPWTPFRAIIVNQTGWQEVVDQVWLTSDSTDGRWAKGHVTYSSPYPHAFMFEAVPNVGQLQYRGHVAIDDVQFSDGPCQAECEFNSDFCQWSNEREHDDFDWSLSRGSLWTSTGPIRDQLSSAHNFNFGGYAYIDSRQPHFAGSRAVMTSEILPATEPEGGPKCFVFWVHMFGAGIGRLRLLQRAASDAGSRTSSDSTGTLNNASQSAREIWRLHDNGPRDSWYRAQVTLASSSPFQIQLEATVGESGYGDIGVDSFRLENGPCPGLPEWAVNRGIDCTFQANSCSWVMTNSQPGIVSMWTRATGDVFAGRPEGHAQFNVLPEPTNGYMMFDTFQNGHRPGSRGYLSALLPPSDEKHCLSFWYYMASNTPSQPRLGALEVQLFEPNTTSGSNGTSIKQATSIVTTTLWRLENHQLEKWLFAQVPFVPARGGYVSFVGVRAEAVRGAIAIDDVSVFKSECSVSPQEASVSLLDCTFDHSLCKWAVDSRSFEPPPPLATNKPTEATSTDVPATSAASGVPEKPAEITPPAATTAPVTTTTTTATTTIRSTVREDEATASAITDPSAASTDDTTAASIVTEETSQVIDNVTEQTPDADLATTTIQTAADTVARTAGATVESDSIRGTGEVFFLNFPGKSDETSTEIAQTPPPPTTETSSTESTESSSTAVTTDEPLVVLSSTPRPTQAPAKVVAASPTRPASKLITLPGNKSKQPVSVVVGESVKNGTLRRIGGLYDEVTSFGANTIEVISTSRDGATKSIIISQPVKTRFRRDSDSDGWRGYNRDPRIVNGRANDPTSRRPLPVPHWLRPRPQEGDARGAAVVPHSVGAFRPMNPSQRHFQPSRPLISLTSSSREPARWMLSSGISSLHGIKDHTFNLAEGGYAFLETQAGQASASRLFSPEFNTNETYCLTFFFTTAYNSPNTTLTVYRTIDTVTEELWRVTSAALDRLDHRLKSPWIPARVPVPKAPSSGSQIIIIEGSSDGGALALDDVRLKKVACSGRP